jgi:hypothetical protein
MTVFRTRLSLLWRGLLRFQNEAMSGLGRLFNRGDPRCHRDWRRKNTMALPKTAERARAATECERIDFQGLSNSDSPFSFSTAKGCQGEKGCYIMDDVDSWATSLYTRIIVFPCILPRMRVTRSTGWQSEKPLEPAGKERPAISRPGVYL